MTSVVVARELLCISLHNNCNQCTRDCSHQTGRYVLGWLGSTAAHTFYPAAAEESLVWANNNTEQSTSKEGRLEVPPPFKQTVDLRISVGVIGELNLNQTKELIAHTRSEPREEGEWIDLSIDFAWLAQCAQAAEGEEFNHVFNVFPDHSQSPMPGTCTLGVVVIMIGAERNYLFRLPSHAVKLQRIPIYFFRHYRV